MSYAQFGLIQALDFNTLVGGNPTTTASTLNATWATGLSAGGYGQTALANVAAGNSVLASQWSALVANTASAASHQGTSITAVTAPASGNTVTYVSAIPTNLTSIWTNRLNAASQGGTSANTATRATSWSSAITFTHTATFANGDAARYFFNSGGQLKMTVAHPGTSGIDLLFNNLASNVGTVVMSALNVPGTQTISGVAYNGITKIGGGAPASTTISATSGYYAQTTSNANVFTQVATTGPASYQTSFIRMITKSNGTQGANGDTGSVITIYTVWDEIPDGYAVSAGSATTMTLVPPATTNIANTWGAITLAGTVAGA
jgi:hypothetical protein